MGGERYFDGSVDIEPFRMVIHFFSNKGDPGHKTEGLNEIGKCEFARDGIAVCNFASRHPRRVAPGGADPVSALDQGGGRPEQRARCLADDYVVS